MTESSNSSRCSSRDLSIFAGDQTSRHTSVRGNHVLVFLEVDMSPHGLIHFGRCTPTDYLSLKRWLIVIHSTGRKHLAGRLRVHHLVGIPKVASRARLVLRLAMSRGRFSANSVFG